MVSVKRRQTSFVCGMLPLALSFSAIVGPASPARAQNWVPIPIVRQSTLNAGFFPGGEGGQVVRTLAISASDPNFVMFGTDVGGIYRSLNGGARWEPCNVGYHPRGANDIAIDPRNSNRVLIVAGNSEYANFGSSNGIYLSTNKGASWSQRLPKTTTIGGSIAYDKSSYNSSLGYCTRAYYVHPSEGVYRTDDGGDTWNLVYSGLWSTKVKVHPTNGTVYIASSHWEHPGFFKSTTQGASFVQTNADYNLSLDVVDSFPNRVYISRWSKVWVSDDQGNNFRYIGNDYWNDGLPDNKEHKEIKVSPANPNHLFVAAQWGGAWWEIDWYRSTNGGNTWSQIGWDNTHAILPYNRRQPVWAWHPTDPNVAFGLGGDWVTRTTDAGATLAWYANGYTGIMAGGTFNFSPTSPNTMLIGFQDYNGAHTSDGGATWTYRDISGNGWGGYCYGGYAVDANVMWVGNAPSWGGTRELKVSRDGGASWTGTGKNFTGPDAGYSDPTNSNIGFASNWRTTDKGVTWTARSGCDAVFTSNPTGARELYGKKGNTIVRSMDRGATWVTVTTVPGDFGDLAFDHTRTRLYVASEDRIKQYQNGVWTTLETPTDQYGSHRVRSVAVDPLNPDIVYAASSRDIWSSSNSVVRSRNAGVSWENLHVNTPLSNTVTGGQKDGPHEAQCVRVHPRTREAWVSGQCYGFWKIAAPDAPVTVNHECPVSPAAKSNDSYTALNESGASGGVSYMLNANQTGDYATFALNSVPPGVYSVRLRYKRHSQRGRYQLSVSNTLNGTYINVGGAMNQSGATGYVEQTIGTVTLSGTGTRYLKFTVTGANTGYYKLNFDVIRLVPSP